MYEEAVVCGFVCRDIHFTVGRVFSYTFGRTSGYTDGYTFNRIFARIAR